MTAGEKIKGIRKAQEVIRSQLAKDTTRVDGTAIRGYGSEIRNPKLEATIRLAEELAADMETLQEYGRMKTDARVSLFCAFEKYSGSIRSGEQVQQDAAKEDFDKSRIYLSFDLLNDWLLEWLERYEEYQDAIKRAEMLPDEEDRQKHKETAGQEYFCWMFGYPEPEQTGTSGQSDPKC